MRKFNRYIEKNIKNVGKNTEIEINKKEYKYNPIVVTEKGLRRGEFKVLNIVLKENKVILMSSYDKIINKVINILKNAFPNNPLSSQIDKINIQGKESKVGKEKEESLSKSVYGINSIIRKINIRKNKFIMKGTAKGILQRMGRGKGSKVSFKVIIPKDSILLSIHLFKPIYNHSYILSTLTKKLNCFKYLTIHYII